jgi:hypothetical protein
MFTAACECMGTIDVHREAGAILPSADGRSYVYSGLRSLASLVVAEGLR